MLKCSWLCAKSCFLFYFFVRAPLYFLCGEAESRRIVENRSEDKPASRQAAERKDSALFLVNMSYYCKVGGEPSQAKSSQAASCQLANWFKMKPLWQADWLALPFVLRQVKPIRERERVRHRPCPGPDVAAARYGITFGTRFEGSFYCIMMSWLKISSWDPFLINCATVKKMWKI